MGVRDTEEQLNACREQSVRDERRILDLERERDALLEKYRARTAELEQELGRQIRAGVELEHLLAQAESALADRLRHDAHGTAAVEADLLSARARLAAIAKLVHPLRDGEPLTAGAVRRILDEVTAEPWGVYLDLDEAGVAERACRHSAATLRTVLELSPERLDPAVAGWLPQLDAVAERLRS
jgi:hypothetical protein